MNLISESRKIFNSLRISELQKAGIEREDIKTSSHSHHIVTYPPLDVLPEINPQKIYSFSHKKNRREIALYLHLPFCTGKCLYCAYISLPNQTEEFVDRYLDAVEKEVNLLQEFPDLKNVVINSVYIGGGTPTYLSTDQINKVFDIIRKFDIKKDAEITVEAGPETLIEESGKDKLKVLLKNNANRLSMGFQTFNDDILKLLRRRHDSREAVEAYKLAEKIGFENINVDLIPGLPDETLKIWEQDLVAIGNLKPASVTCYPLSIKKTAAIWSLYQKEKFRFPSREDVLIMHIMANEFFKRTHYTQRPVWWFTKTPKFVYKQQIYKWGELKEQLALGVSGYSFMNNHQYFNRRSLPEYFEQVENNRLPIWKGIRLSQEDLMRRMILFGLKTGLSKKLFYEKFRIFPEDTFKEIWNKLRDLDLIDENKEMIQLSYKGKLFADEIAKEFYEKKIKL